MGTNEDMTARMAQSGFGGPIGPTDKRYVAPPTKRPDYAFPLDYDPRTYNDADMFEYPAGPLELMQNAWYAYPFPTNIGQMGMDAYRYSKYYK